MRQVILDTGPLVAAINRRDNYHEWTVCQLASIRPPLLTCEAVVSEACFLLRGHGDGIKALFEWMGNGAIRLAFRLDTETEQIGKLMRKYADVPMALADVCLVRMSEIHTHSAILTLDSDFLIYRKHGKRMIQTIMPENE